MENKKNWLWLIISFVSIFLLAYNLLIFSYILDTWPPCLNTELCHSLVGSYSEFVKEHVLFGGLPTVLIELIMIAFVVDFIFKKIIQRYTKFFVLGIIILIILIPIERFFYDKAYENRGKPKEGEKAMSLNGTNLKYTNGQWINY